jgi:hypothetical protein
MSPVDPASLRERFGILNMTIRSDMATTLQELIVFFFAFIPLLPTTRKPRKIFTSLSEPETR